MTNVLVSQIFKTIKFNYIWTRRCPIRKNIEYFKTRSRLGLPLSFVENGICLSIPVVYVFIFLTKRNELLLYDDAFVILNRDSTLLIVLVIYVLARLILLVRRYPKLPPILVNEEKNATIFQIPHFLIGKQEGSFSLSTAKIKKVIVPRHGMKFSLSYGHIDIYMKDTAPIRITSLKGEVTTLVLSFKEHSIPIERDSSNWLRIFYVALFIVITLVAVDYLADKGYIDLSHVDMSGNSFR